MRYYKHFGSCRLWLVDNDAVIPRLIWSTFEAGMLGKGCKQQDEDVKVPPKSSVKVKLVSPMLKFVKM